MQKYLNIFRCASLACITGIFLSGCAAALLAGATGTGASVIANHMEKPLPIKTQINDKKIKNTAYSQIKQQRNKFHQKAYVSVSVSQGRVLLVGQVESVALADAIATQVSKIEDVTLVYDHMKIGPKLNAKVRAHDSFVTAKVKSRLTQGVNPFHFNVTTNDNTVYLLADTTSFEGKKAAHIASLTKGVNKVVTSYHLQDQA